MADHLASWAWLEIKIKICKIGHHYLSRVIAQSASWSEDQLLDSSNLNLHLIFLLIPNLPASSHFICSWHVDCYTGLDWHWAGHSHRAVVSKWWHCSASQYSLCCWAGASNISILTANCLIILYFTLNLLRIKSNNFFSLTSHQVNYFQSHQMCKYYGQDWVCCTNWNTQDKISPSWFSRPTVHSQLIQQARIKLFLVKNII